MRKRLFAIFAAFVLALGLLAAITQYFKFVSKTIYTESTAHLREIYHQTNQSLNMMVGRNWSAMQMWVPYLRDISDEQQIKNYIYSLREESGFTDFYFISREGNYQTVDGKTGYLTLQDRLPDLILNGENVVVNSVVPGQPEIMVFAVPAGPGTYRGFA